MSGTGAPGSGVAAVGVVGAGRWGRVLAGQARRRGHDVWLWDEDPDALAALGPRAAKRKTAVASAALEAGIQLARTPAELAERSHTLLVAVPVARLRPVAVALGAVVDGSHVVVHAVRGLEPSTLAAPSRVLREELATRKIGALLGPVLADELVRGRPNAAVVASRFDEVERAATLAFAGDNLLLYGNPDLEGVELAATAASALSVGLGLALALDLGPAGLALLIARAAAEMARLVEAGGGQARTAYGLAGLGFLIVQREAQRRDVQAGRLLAAGRSPAEVEAELGGVDGFRATEALAKLAAERKATAHLTRALAAILAGTMSAADVAQRVLAVGSGRE